MQNRGKPEFIKELEEIKKLTFYAGKKVEEPIDDKKDTDKKKNKKKR